MAPPRYSLLDFPGHLSFQCDLHAPTAISLPGLPQNQCLTFLDCPHSTATLQSSSVFCHPLHLTFSCGPDTHYSCLLSPSFSNLHISNKCLRFATPSSVRHPGLSPFVGKRKERRRQGACEVSRGGMVNVQKEAGPASDTFF